MSIDLITPGREFARVLSDARSRANADFEWYRYDSMSNLVMLSDLLEESQMQAAREEGVLDAGCGDGDLAFFFESLGCEVVAADHPGPNHNGMRGVRKLKETLSSRVEIREIDFDSQFSPLGRRFGLTLFLGALYHLKNPFFALEVLSKTSKWCVLSTRIARRFPNAGRAPANSALVYLLDRDELNADDSNFWIFSEGALRRLLKRTNWRICAFRTMGAQNSDATSLENDERAFCLLRSEFGIVNVDLVAGWNEAEPGGWRWTRKKFSVRALGGRASRITLNLFLPAELVSRPLTLQVRAGGKTLAPAVFDRPGPETLVRDFEGDTVEFELDRAIEGDENDERERGIIVGSVTLD